MKTGNIIFFASPKELREWFERNHESSKELWIGYYKKNSGKTSVDWSQSVDVAICFGWIDGIRKSIDELSYTNRFTPRKSDSTWSAVNIKKAEKLIAEGLMSPRGLEIFRLRKPENTSRYSFENSEIIFPDEYEQFLRSNKIVWTFFRSLSPSIRKTSTWWVLSAKKKETQLNRLQVLFDSCLNGEKIPALRRRNE